MARNTQKTGDSEVDMVQNKQNEARIAFQKADDAWSARLRSVFGTRAGDMRYVSAGKGEVGSALRVAYEAREVARIAYDRACGRDEHGLPLKD